jgi:PilZ domain
VDKQNIPEKRKSPRVNVISLVIIRCDVRAQIGDKEVREFHTHTENLSEGGINVILDEELRSPASVELKLYVTGKISPIKCKGQIAWSKIISPPVVNPNMFSTGIKFTELNLADKEILGNVISCFSDQEKQE